MEVARYAELDEEQTQNLFSVMTSCARTSPMGPARFAYAASLYARFIKDDGIWGIPDDPISEDCVNG